MGITGCGEAGPRASPRPLQCLRREEHTPRRSWRESRPEPDPSPDQGDGGSRPRSRGKAQTWETGVRPPAPSTLGSRLPSPARRGGHRRAWHREGQRSCVSAACASFKCSVSHPSRKSRCAGRADPTLRPASPRTGNPTARLLLEQSGRRLLEWPFTAEENPSPRSQH